MRRAQLLLQTSTKENIESSGEVAWGINEESSYGVSSFIHRVIESDSIACFRYVTGSCILWQAPVLSCCLSASQEKIHRPASSR